MADPLKKLHVPQDLLDAAKELEVDAEKLVQLLVEHAKQTGQSWIDWLKAKLP